MGWRLVKAAVAVSFLGCLAAPLAANGQTRPAPAVASAAAANSLPTLPVASAGPLIRRWAATHMADNQAMDLTTAIAVARRFDVIVATRSTFAPYVRAMHQANPRLMILVYNNAAFARDVTGWPASAVEHDAAGHPVRSASWGNYWMNIRDAGWDRSAAQSCAVDRAVDHYDGCYYDLLGTAPLQPGYMTGTGIDPSTNRPWTGPDYVTALTNLTKEIDAANPGVAIAGNTVSNGSRYFGPTSTRSVLAELSAGHAEDWLRTATSPAAAFETEAQWREDVDLLVAAAAAGQQLMVQTKVWVNATAAQIDAWHRYTVASFLLGTDGRSYLTFSAGRTMAAATADSPYDRVDIGAPVGAYAKLGGVYERRFTRGLAVVNPTGSAATLTLDGSYTDLGGVLRTSLTLPAHTGEVLTSSPPAVRATALVQQSGGGLGLFTVDSSGAVAERDWGTAAGWSSATAVGGRLVGAPAVAAGADGTVTLFGRGTDNALWVNSSNAPGAYRGWRSLGGRLAAAPAAVDAPGGAVSFAHGVDGALWEHDPAAGWRPLGGRLAAGAAVCAAATAPGLIRVFVVGTDGAVWTRGEASGRGSGWASLGGRAVGGPAAVSPASGMVDLFARGSDNALWTRHFDGTRWSVWMSLGGRLNSSPAAAGLGDTHVVVVGVDGRLWQRVHSGGAWAGWAALP